MSRNAILVEKLGKRFFIGARAKQADTIGETLAITASRHLQKLRCFFRPSVHGTTPGIEEFWALRDVSFTVKPGDVLGIIGRNGSGKSTLLKILSKITPPTEGEATIMGRVGSLLEIGTGFHGELTGRENILLSGTILGIRREEIKERFEEIIDFSGVEHFIDTPVKHYSSGMYLRLAFAVAAHMRTEILLVDEILAVGDAMFQRKCMDKMSEVAREGRTVVFVSHNLGAVAQLCETGIVLDGGAIAATGSANEAIAAYGKLMAANSYKDDSSDRVGVGISALQVRTEGSRIDSSCPLIFVFDLTIRQPFINFLVFLGITSEGSQLVLDVASAEQFPEFLNPGRYHVRVELPPLWLRPRIYQSWIKMVAHDEFGVTKRFRSDVLEMTIDTGKNVDDILNRMLVPNTRWAVTKVDSIPEVASLPMIGDELTDRRSS